MSEVKKDKKDKPAFDTRIKKVLGIEVLVTDKQAVKKHHNMLNRVKCGVPIHPHCEWYRKHNGCFAAIKVKKVKPKPKKAEEKPEITAEDVVQRITEYAA